MTIRTSYGLILVDCSILLEDSNNSPWIDRPVAVGDEVYVHLDDGDTQSSDYSDDSSIIDTSLSFHDDGGDDDLHSYNDEIRELLDAYEDLYVGGQLSSSYSPLSSSHNHTIHSLVARLEGIPSTLEQASGQRQQYDDEDSVILARNRGIALMETVHEAQADEEENNTDASEYLFGSQEYYFVPLKEVNTENTPRDSGNGRNSNSQHLAMPPSSSKQRSLRRARRRQRNRDALV